MVSISASYVITLYLLMQFEGRTKVKQRRQQYDQIDKGATLTRMNQRSELEICHAAKPVEKHSTN